MNSSITLITHETRARRNFLFDERASEYTIESSVSIQCQKHAMNSERGKAAPATLPSCTCCSLTSRADVPQAQRRASRRQRYPRATWNIVTPYRIFLTKSPAHPCPTDGLHGVPRGPQSLTALGPRRKASTRVFAHGTIPRIVSRETARDRARASAF